MSISLERLRAVAARSPRAADALVRTLNLRDGDDTSDVVCWVQTVLPADAAAAQIAVAETSNAAEAARAKSARVAGGPGWARAVEVDEQWIEGDRLFITRYVFKAR